MVEVCTCWPRPGEFGQWTVSTSTIRMSLSESSWPQQFYTRLLRCRRPEVIIVLLFLTLVIVFQLAAPSIFRRLDGDDDDDLRQLHIQTTILSYREALWEVDILKEEFKQKEAEIKALRKTIEQLNREPSEIKKPEVREGTVLSAVPYYSFDRNGAYSANGLFASDVVLGGFRKALIDEFNAIGVYITTHYNANLRGGIFWKALHVKSEPGNMTVNHFRTGIYRYIPQQGVEYQLYFSDPSPADVMDHNLYKIRIDQPVGQSQYYLVEYVNSRSSKVNIVVSLKGRLDTCQAFLLHLVKLKASTDFDFHLTLIYFGEEGLQRLYHLISNARKLGFRNIKLIQLPEEQFSRGLGIQRGIEKWKTGNDVMFICDVDVIIKREFLEHCVLHTSRGQSVYYPVVFSLFNPQVVTFFTNTSGGIRTEEDLLTVSQQKGFWRDFGYGMLCVHRSDFFKVGGYRQWTRKSGGEDRYWGSEDIDLYKRFVAHPKLTVIRAPDPDVFHKWHPKDCPEDLPSERLIQCQTSMVANEGSQKQMGLLHYDSVYRDFLAANSSLSMKYGH